MTKEELLAALELPLDSRLLHNRAHIWPVVAHMTKLGFRFILSRSQHRPRGLPAWRASFCRYGGTSNRWFGNHPGEAVLKSAMIAVYNREHPEDRYVQQVTVSKGCREE